MKRGIWGFFFKWFYGGLMDLDVIYFCMGYCFVCKGFFCIVIVIKSKFFVIGFWYVWYLYMICFCYNGFNKFLCWSFIDNNVKNIIIFLNFLLIEWILDYA